MGRPQSLRAGTPMSIATQYEAGPPPLSIATDYPLATIVLTGDDAYR
jgi:hypothetical protein